MSWIEAKSPNFNHTLIVWLKIRRGGVQSQNDLWFENIKI